jgi:hypothetical protein
MAETNIEELEAHLSRVFKGMLKSKEVAEAGKDAGRAMGRHVGDTLLGGGDSGYNYRQSGDLEKLVSEEGRNPEIKQTQNKMSIGVFEINNMNMGVYAKRNHQFQFHQTWDETLHEMVTTRISLQAEKELPKWILAEYGSGSKSEGIVQPEFRVTYTSRDKPYLYGPSVGPVTGPGGGPKLGFFKVNQRGLENLLGPRITKMMDSHREHQGTRAGHVFSLGLESAKQEVFEILGEGLETYLNNN